MTREEALLLIEHFFENGCLNHVQEAVFRHAWDGKSYTEMASLTGYDAGYLKDTGSKFWRTLSQGLGQKVTKHNFKGVLKKYFRTSEAGENSRSPKITISAIQANFSQRLEIYTQWYLETYGLIKILPGLMRKPISLEAIYVDVKMLDQQSKQLLSPSAIEHFCQKFESRSLFGGELPRRDGLAVAQDYPYLMVLGSPGIGKSTFLKKLGLHALRTLSAATTPQIPVLIELKRLQQTSFDWQDIIHQILFRQPDSEGIADVEHHLRQGSFLLLLDGLDEVHDTHRGDLVRQIQSFIQTYPGNRVVISCRTAAHYFNFTQFVDVIVAEFSDAQIRIFLDNWFEKVTDSLATPAETVWTFLKDRKNAPLLELARNPLLLTYFCLVFESMEVFPATRHFLYEQVLNLFLREWTQQKNLTLSKSFQLPLYLQKRLLAEIAYETFVAKQLFISERYLRQKILTFREAHAPENSNIDPDDYLQYLATQQGILAERFQGHWSFSHLTLQENLVAQFIVDNAQTDFLINECLTNRRWREVILLTTECLDSKACEYLKAIQAQADKVINDYPKLKDILRWTKNRFRGASDASLPVSKRASLIAALSVIAASRASDFDIDNSVGYKIAFALVTGCASAVAIAQEGSALYQAAITSSVTIAAARANAADEARANNIDFVIREARDLIDDVSNESGILREYDRARIVRRGIGFSSQAANAGKHSSSSFSEMLIELADQLHQALDSVPNETADKQTWRAWADQLENSWVKVFGCSKDLMTLTLVEAEAFETYLYLTELQIRCLDSTWGISEGARQALMQELLT